jgi:AcrR family transcriptional regulator
MDILNMVPKLLEVDLDPRRIPAQERSKERVERILRATAELLVEYGVGLVTTARIAERAEVPIGSVYQYFPNKKAIFVALFTTYLCEIQAGLAEFEKNAPYDAGWRVVLADLFREIKRIELRGGIDESLRVAVQAFPELIEYERQHMELVVASLARILKRLGSQWPRSRLRRLGTYYYYVNDGALRYRNAIHPPAREVFEWDQQMATALVRMCMPD